MNPNASAGAISAVILAGGKGSRLKPFTTVFPKPLVPLGEKPIIEILLRRLASFQIKDVTLCTGHLAELIMVVCGDGSKYGMKIKYVHEDQPLGTAGPLAGLKEISDPFVVMNGDLLTTLNFANMFAFHRSEGADVTVAIYPRDIKMEFGLVDADEHGRFIGFREKPTYHFEVSMGVNILSRSALRFVTPGKYLDMPDLILKVHESGGKVRCYREDCYWLDIGRMEDYGIAQEQFAQNERMFLGEAE